MKPEHPGAFQPCSFAVGFNLLRREVKWLGQFLCYLEADCTKVAVDHSLKSTIINASNRQFSSTRASEMSRRFGKRKRSSGSAEESPRSTGGVYIGNIASGNSQNIYGNLNVSGRLLPVKSTVRY